VPAGEVNEDAIGIALDDEGAGIRSVDLALGGERNVERGILGTERTEDRNGSFPGREVDEVAGQGVTDGVELATVSGGDEAVSSRDGGRCWRGGGRGEGLIGSLGTGRENKEGEGHEQEAAHAQRQNLAWQP